MKNSIRIICLALLVWSCMGCEYHRRLEELRRQQRAQQLRTEQRLKDLARQDLYNAQQKAYEDVRESIYGDSYGGDPYYSSSSNYQVEPPIGNKFCGRGREYYCPLDAKCVQSSDGSYRCRFENKVHVSRGHVTHHGSHGSHGGTGSTSRYVYPSTSGSSSHYPITSSSSVHYPSTSGSSVYYPRTSGSLRYPSYTGGSRIHPTVRYPSYNRQTVYTCPAGTERVNITSRSFKCEDVDECDTGANICEGKCVNTYGSFHCACDYGYEADEYRCNDVDECEDSTRCRGRICNNTIGSYECTCPDGYRLDFNQCKDNDECKPESPCDDDELCLNLWGSYECNQPTPCPDGYQRSSHDTDINGKCILANTSNADINTPNSIQYKTMIVEARKRPSWSNELGVMTFSSTQTYSTDGTRYRHRFSARLVDGNTNFSIRTIQRVNGIEIKFFNRKPLAPNVRLPLKLLITNTAIPTTYSYNPYSYYDRPRAVTSRQEIDMTIVPQDHPGMSDDFYRYQ